MSELNLLAKPFVPKSKKYFTEEEFISLKQELENERNKSLDHENKNLNILKEIKSYIMKVEEMKKIHQNEKSVLSIRIDALQDIRDVLYNQITGLHVNLEKLKSQIKILENDKTQLQETLDKTNEQIKIIESEKNTLQQEINSIKETYMTHYMNLQHQATSYYPYYYYQYYQNGNN